MSWCAVTRDRVTVRHAADYIQSIPYCSQTSGLMAMSRNGSPRSSPDLFLDSWQRRGIVCPRRVAGPRGHRLGHPECLLSPPSSARSCSRCGLSSRPLARNHSFGALATKTSAMRAPILLVPPVITATFSLSGNMVLDSSSWKREGLVPHFQFPQLGLALKVRTITHLPERFSKRSTNAN